MQFYPVFIAASALRALVVGAGKVGRRKIVSLCESGAADVLACDPFLDETGVRELEALGARVVLRVATQKDVADRTLVFAATNDAGENARIAALCASLGVLCNVADDPGAGSFHVPSHAKTRGLSAAFSTGGQSPALARRIREETAPLLEANYGPLLVFMGRLRPMALALGVETEANSALFRAVAYSNLDKALQRKDAKAAWEIAAALLPPALHGRIEELLDGLC